jgi:hypothetical protein
MSITATCTFCERTITLGIENQWFDSNGNYRCGEGAHIGWHHTPKGSTISRESAPFPETAEARNLLAPTLEDNPKTNNPKIKARIRLENGKLISKANAARLVIRGTKDISKTVRGCGFTPEYRELWVVAREPEGYIWRERVHAMGINGHHQTLRALIYATVWLGYEIEVLPEPLNQEVFDSIKRTLEKKNI